MVLSVVFFPVRSPAFHKSRSEILRSRSDPALDDALSEKGPGFDFASVWPEVAVEVATIEPDEFLPGPY